MKVNLVKIGNSQGVRIPKALIEQCGLGAQAELSVEDGALVLRPANPPRAGWSEAFERAEPAGEEALLPDDTSAAWDGTEWTW